MKKLTVLTIALLSTIAFAQNTQAMYRPVGPQFPPQVREPEGQPRELPVCGNWRGQTDWRLYMNQGQDDRRTQDHALIMQYLEVLNRNIAAVCQALHITPEVPPMHPTDTTQAPR